MTFLLRFLISVASVAVVLCCLSPSTTAQPQAGTYYICYTLNPPANTATNGSIYGNWNAQLTATLTIASYTLPTGYTYSGGANSSYTPFQITAITAGTRTFTSATGVTFQSTFGGSSGALLSVNAIYAPSGITANISNDNLIFINSNNVWTTTSGGFAFTITPSAANAGTPGLPGFPKTARFNTATILKVTSLASGAIQETGYGQVTIDGTIGAASSYTASNASTAAGGTGPVATTTLGSSTPSPSCPAPTTTSSVMNQPFCYLLYPHETVQNGMWSIATSGVLQTSTTAYAVPGSAAGSASRSAYFVYGITGMTRTFIDQFGTSTTVSGGIMQGPGGDGGTDNFLYTATNSTDAYGGLVDGDGFTFTFYNGSYYGSLTPGDPTLAYAINFYYETWYREAAEPWHEDEEYANPSTASFVVSTGSSAPTCTAKPFTPVTQPAGYGTPVQYSFCSYITADTGAAGSVGSWTVVTSGVLSVTTTYFTSFATADTQFYQIGTGITGTRTYIPSSGANSTGTITGLLSPGGDGQNNNKLYNATNAPAFDDGGWSYYITTPTVPGVTASGSAATTIIRLYYSDSGYWTEQALPSFQNEAPASKTASSFSYQPLSQGTITCPPSGASGNAAHSKAAGSVATAVVMAGAAAAGVALLL